MQEDFNIIITCLDKWLVSLNLNKCKVVEYSYPLVANNKYYVNKNAEQAALETVNAIEALGIISYPKLRFDRHIHQKINKAHSLLGLIKRNFTDLYVRACAIVQHKTVMRPHLEYTNIVWSPYRHMRIEEVEKVQVRATRLLKKIKRFSYGERLKKLIYPH